MSSFVIRILGRNTKEVGNNFELLAKELLARLGYGSFVRNAYKTGAEIDLRATHRITNAPLLAECKAQGKASDTPSVKLFFAEWEKERRTDERLFGIMLSTSGFTGTAMQWYLELDAATRQQFTLIDSTDLMRHLIELNLTLPPDAINRTISEYQQLGRLDTSWLTYSQYGFAWISLFVLDNGRRLFAVVDEHGRPLQSWKAKEIAQLVRRPLRDAEFFGLDLREKIQLHLLKNGAVSVQSLAQETEEASTDVDRAVQLLEQDGRIRRKGERLDFVQDLLPFLNTARESLDSENAVQFTASAFAQSMIQSVAVLSYLEQRYRLHLSPEQRTLLTQVLRVSPTALRYALFSDPARYVRTYEHINEILKADEKEKWLALHSSSLLQAVFFHAVHDLTSEDSRLSAHLAKLGIKRFRIRATLHAIGMQWEPLKLASETNVAIGVAGGEISAGSLISYSDPAEFCLWDGLLFLEAEEFDQAEALFREAREEAKKADNIGQEQAALNNLALVYMRQKRFDKASEVLQKASSLNVSVPSVVLTNRVICLMELGRVEEAAEVVSDALCRFPELEQTEVIRRYRFGWPKDAD